MEGSASVDSGAASSRFFLEVFGTKPVITYQLAVVESSEDGLMAHKDMAIYWSMCRKSPGAEPSPQNHCLGDAVPLSRIAGEGSSPKNPLHGGGILPTM